MSKEAHCSRALSIFRANDTFFLPRAELVQCLCTVLHHLIQKCRKPMLGIWKYHFELIWRIRNRVLWSRIVDEMVWFTTVVDRVFSRVSVLDMFPICAADYLCLSATIVSERLLWTIEQCITTKCALLEKNAQPSWEQLSIGIFTRSLRYPEIRILLSSCANLFSLESISVLHASKSSATIVVPIVHWRNIGANVHSRCCGKTASNEKKYLIKFERF